MKKIIFSLLALVVAFSAMAESRTDKLLRELRNPKSEYVFVIAHILSEEDLLGGRSEIF